MLVLSRKKDEMVTIGENIRVLVVEIRGGNVRLGITAPDDVPIHREEVHQQLQKKGKKQIESRE